MSSATPLSIHLVLPGLVPEAPEAWPGVLARLPALRRLLARARADTAPAQHIQAVLLQTFGIAPQPDWPVAPFTLLADGLLPGEACWLRADPVHLLPQQSQLVLVEAQRLRLAMAECEPLITSLNAHFQPDGLSFTAPHSSRWYLRAPQPLQIRSTPPDAATGRSVDPLLPGGADGLLVHRWSNEIQMLLYDHPVNLQREARGEPAVNSLWLWGAGRLLHDEHPPVWSVWADDPLARGIARARALPLRAAPGSVAEWLAAAGAGEHLIVLDALAMPARREDIHEWQEGAEILERDWFASLVSAVSAGRLRRVTLVTYHGGQALRFNITPPDLWKVWRRSVRMPAAVTGASVHG